MRSRCLNAPLTSIFRIWCRAMAAHFTGEVISAGEALRLGLVKEVVARERVLERAWEIERRVAEKSDSTLRFTRSIML